MSFVSGRTYARMKKHEKTSPLIGVIADDLTGCGDVGVFCARSGLKTRIFISIDNAVKSRISHCDAVLINTNSRICSPQEAYRRVIKAAGILKAFKTSFFLKKLIQR